MRTVALLSSIHARFTVKAPSEADLYLPLMPLIAHAISGMK